MQWRYWLLVICAVVLSSALAYTIKTAPSPGFSQTDWESAKLLLNCCRRGMIAGNATRLVEIATVEPTDDFPAGTTLIEYDQAIQSLGSTPEEIEKFLLIEDIAEARETIEKLEHYHYSSDDDEEAAAISRVAQLYWIIGSSSQISAEKIVGVPKSKLTKLRHRNLLSTAQSWVYECQRGDISHALKLKRLLDEDISPQELGVSKQQALSWARPLALALASRQLELAASSASSAFEVRSLVMEFGLTRRELGITAARMRQLLKEAILQSAADQQKFEEFSDAQANAYIAKEFKRSDQFILAWNK